MLSSRAIPRAHAAAPEAVPLRAVPEPAAPSPVATSSTIGSSSHRNRYSLDSHTTSSPGSDSGSERDTIPSLHHDLGPKRDDLPRVQLAFEHLSYAVDVRAAVNASASQGGDVEAPHAPADPSRARRFAFPRRTRMQTTKKTILHGLTGTFPPASLTAVLGPSGSGKTTLLNILAGLPSQGTVSGRVTLNGHVLPPRAVRRVAGFVFQDDLVLPTMTTREALAMAATLRSPPSPEEETRRRVDGALALLGLEGAADTLIGGVGGVKGVSGGERKRVAIGMELLGRPQVLVLDEPTSGLDSFTAYSVVCLLRDLAHLHAKTVVATMHQPSSEIVAAVDYVLVLVAGRILYHGRAGDMVAYFSRLGFKCPRYANVADYVFAGIINKKPRAGDAGVDALVAHFAQVTDGGRTPLIVARRRRARAPSSDVAMAREPGVAVAPQPHRARGCALVTTDQQHQHQQHQHHAHRLHFGNGHADETLPDDLARSAKYYPSTRQQMRFLFKRSLDNELRNKLMVQARLGQMLFLGVLLGLIYLAIESKNVFGFAFSASLDGVLFFGSVNMLFSATMPNLSVFTLERPVFLREHVSGYYGVFAYYTSRTVVDLPFQIIFPAIYATVSYWMVGFSYDVAEWLLYTLFLVLVGLVGGAFGIAIGSQFEDLNIALIAVPLVLLPLMIYGGLFVNSAASPAWLSWLEWVSPVQYAFTGVAINYWRGNSVNGVDGDTHLRDLGVARRLGIIPSAFLLVAIWAALTVAGYLGLRRIARRATGMHRPARERVAAAAGWHGGTHTHGHGQSAVDAASTTMAGQQHHGTGAGNELELGQAAVGEVGPANPWAAPMAR